MKETKHGEGHRQCNVRPSNTGCGQRDVYASLTTSEYGKRASVHINKSSDGLLYRNTSIPVPAVISSPWPLP